MESNIKEKEGVKSLLNLYNIDDSVVGVYICTDYDNVTEIDGDIIPDVITEDKYLSDAIYDTLLFLIGSDDHEKEQAYYNLYKKECHELLSLLKALNGGSLKIEGHIKNNHGQRHVKTVEIKTGIVKELIKPLERIDDYYTLPSKKLMNVEHGSIVNCIIEKLEDYEVIFKNPSHRNAFIYDLMRFAGLINSKKIIQYEDEDVKDSNIRREKDKEVTNWIRAYNKQKNR